MMTWGAFLGGMVKFLVEKLLGKKIELALNDRRRAARAFLRLHQLIGELVELSIQIEAGLGNPERDWPRSKGAWLFEIDQRASRLSNEFFALSDELMKVLEIYDPTLANALGNLAYVNVVRDAPYFEV